LKRIREVPLTAAERQRRHREKQKGDQAFIARRRMERSKSYRQHKAKNLARSQRWAEANRDRTRSASKLFYERHLEAERLRNAEKSRRRNAAIQLGDRVDYAAIVRDSLGICAICDEPVIYEPAHIDHIVPLARGGTHTSNNLQFTHARCNLAKGAKLLMKAG
jgi:5-methylcytosine-specific restriction endonuclease McrA